MGNFNSVLKALRKSKGLTQDDLAKILKVSRSTIGMYENASREPDYETLEAIADYFNVDIDYLLGRTLKTTKIIHPSNQSEYDIIIETQGEADLVVSYRALDDINKKKSSSYVRNLLHNQTLENELTAAHERTDVPHTKEGLQHDLDIMNDPNW